jgi:hypothetical protein
VIAKRLRIKQALIARFGRFTHAVRRLRVVLGAHAGAGGAENRHQLK